jgi:hypothetical protein
VGRVRSFARRPPGPAMDPLASTSRLLRDGLIDPQHARVPGQVRALLEWSRAERGDGPLGPEALSTRTRRLELFQTQPFFVAAPWTARPGESVPFEDTLADYSALVDGAADTLPQEALRYVGRWRPTYPSEAPGQLTSLPMAGNRSKVGDFCGCAAARRLRGEEGVTLGELEPLAGGQADMAELRAVCMGAGSICRDGRRESRSAPGCRVTRRTPRSSVAELEWGFELEPWTADASCCPVRAAGSGQAHRRHRVV